VTTISTAFGATATTFGTMSAYTCALVSSSRSRPCGSEWSVAPPARSFTPAVMITSAASSSAS
jgi:hypothetical protein